MKKQVSIFILFVVLSSSVSAQNQQYICNNNGIYKVDLASCSTQLLFSAWSTLSLTDLAVTPSGELYAINFEKLFKIDTLNGDAALIATISTSVFGFNSLVALNNDYVLAVKMDSGVYKINVHSGMMYYLGDIGYYPLGDLTFFKGHYYMAAAGNKLIRFDYNRYTDKLSNIELVGTINTNNANKAIYSLVSVGTETCESKDNLKLIAFEFNEIFEVDPNTAACSQICSSFLPVIGASGAASIDEVQNQVFDQDLTISVPNIFTPNGDLINDFFESQDLMWDLSSCSISVFNRWGNLVFDDQEKDYFRWDGTASNGELCPDGVYYYKINLKGYCDNEAELTGFIQLIR